MAMANPAVCFILMKDISDSFPKGSLVNPRDIDKARKSYILHPLHSGMKEKSSSVCSEINEWDVSPVSAEDFQYLCRISESKDRYDVFKSPYKLKWAKTLKCGSRAYAKLRKKKSTDETVYTAVEIQWVGHTKIGIKFGVEIIDPFYKGQGDVSVNNFFKCADKCGMLLDLDRLECDKLLHPMSGEAGAVSFLSDAAPQLQVLSLMSNDNKDIQTKEDVTSKEVPEGSKSRQDLKKEIKILKEQHRKEKEEAAAREREAEKKIAALQGQIQRELSLHRSEMEEKDDHMGEELEKMDGIMKQLQSELLKKAENHAAELQDVVDHNEQQKRESEEDHQKLMHELNKHFQNEVKTANSQLQQVLTQTWEIGREEIESSDVTLASGKSGDVVKGYFRGIQVAVKKLHPHVITEKNEHLVRRQVSVLAQIRHPNLLLFLGATISDPKEKGGSSLIVNELLDESLRSAYEQSSVSKESKIPILADVASALVYLHTYRVPIVHKALSSSRVLLEAVGGLHQWKAKLSVFGPVNVIPDMSPTTDAYAAPESVLGDHSNLTEKVDVYSYGVLICEVVLCRRPPSDRQEFPIMLGDVYLKDRDLFQLAIDCTKQSHKERYSMIEVLKKLRPH